MYNQMAHLVRVSYAFPGLVEETALCGERQRWWLRN